MSAKQFYRASTIKRERCTFTPSEKPGNVAGLSAVADRAAI
ncbi:hypothetical protein SAMN05216428_1175 [Nitrosospira sp. Nsp11]|nr:hypothetical protein [Nitrosospira sp. Nsp11]SHM20042.1 hypothetical protein SAMN05216428_1175 [Nitrosospira sp. Nsp11]